MKTFKILITLVTFCLLVSCKDNKPSVQNNNISSTIKYAKGFDIQTIGNETKLIIKAPYPDATESFEFILSKNENTSKNHIKTRINSIVVTTTIHIPYL